MKIEKKNVRQTKRAFWLISNSQVVRFTRDCTNRTESIWTKKNSYRSCRIINLRPLYEQKRKIKRHKNDVLITKVCYSLSKPVANFIHHHFNNNIYATYSTFRESRRKEIRCTLNFSHRFFPSIFVAALSFWNIVSSNNFNFPTKCLNSKCCKSYYRKLLKRLLENYIKI